jgi:hypothetical protein
MAIQQKVSGVGKNSSRTDQNVVERTQRAQRGARIENASGGTYGSRATNEQLAQGSATAPTASSVTGQQEYVNPIKAIPATAYSATQVPLSEGAPGGPGSNTGLAEPVDAVDPGSVLARALLAANPNSSQLIALVEAYNELGI